MKYTDRISANNRMIAHYDDELKAYKKLTDDIENFVKLFLESHLRHNMDILNEILLKIETFKEEHPEYSDENPVEFNDEES